MLRYLRVSNLAVVREVAIELEDGLTVLTGETGAGKSILVDALTLLLGARASADLVRTGADAACVEGIFRVEGNGAALGVLAELELKGDEGDLVVRREVGASGRGRVFLNGTLQPVASLRRLGASLADVYGQHEHVRLLDASTHLDLVDHFAGLGPLRLEAAGAYRRWQDLEERIASVTAGEAERLRRADFLEFQLGEIRRVAPVPGEDEELVRERNVLANRTRVLELSEGGYQALYESEGAVLDRLAALSKDLEELSRYDHGVAPLVSQVDSLRAGLEDVALTLRDRARDIPLEPGRLEQVESRLAELDRLRSRFGPGLADVLAHSARAEEELRCGRASQEERQRLEGERDRARDHYEELARELGRRRREAARSLEGKVQGELEELAMEKTRLEIRFTDAEPSSSGRERVEIHVSTNPGEDPRPLARVASGGELSRLLLAVRTVASDPVKSRIAVFHGLEAGLGGKVAVFDEVDAGIGGRVAHVLARKLRRLARGRQVLCVTHLPPIAAAAEHHLRVRKEELEGRAEVRVEPVSGEERIEELCRMIGGEAVTDAVRRHASELLALLGAGEG